MKINLNTKNYNVNSKGLEIFTALNVTMKLIALSPSYLWSQMEDEETRSTKLEVAMIKPCRVGCKLDVSIIM